MAYIKLSDCSLAIIDDEDIGRVINNMWHKTHGYAGCSNYNNTGVRVRLHRIIMDCPKGLVVDHINHNRLDCRKSNLRICHQSQNSRNSNGKSKNKKHGQYKGVFWSSRSKNWIAAITFNRKNIHLGCYYSETSAALAYDRAAEKYFGEYASLNIPNNKSIPKKDSPILKSKNTSGLRGVERRGKKFMAYAGKKSLGTFETPIEAALAFNHRAIELYGSNAIINRVSLF